MLQRHQGTILMPSGAHRSVAVFELPDVPLGTPTPPHVILSYRTQKKVYGRERLMDLDYEEVVELLDRDFGVRQRKSPKDALSVTFYRTQGASGTYHTTLMSIDYQSWEELLRTVIRIDLAEPEPSEWPPYVYGIATLPVLYILWNCLPF